MTETVFSIVFWMTRSRAYSVLQCTRSN